MSTKTENKTQEDQTKGDQTANDSEEEEEQKPDELAMLKDRAKQLSIKHHPSIGVDALREKVNAKINGDPEPKDEAGENEVGTSNLTENQRKAALRKQMVADQTKLVRLRISNMNPAKRDLSGEIFTVANRYLGTIRKFVPYNGEAAEAYHVPYVIYKMMKSKKFLQKNTKPDPQKPGNIQVITKWVPEFALEVLPPLSEKELKELANRQAAAAGMVA